MLRTLFLIIVFLMIRKNDYNIKTITECLEISRSTFYRWKAVSQQKAKKVYAFNLHHALILSILSSHSPGQCMGMLSLAGIRTEFLSDQIFKFLLNSRIYKEEDPYDVAKWVETITKEGK